MGEGRSEFDWGEGGRSLIGGRGGGGVMKLNCAGSSTTPVMTKKHRPDAKKAVNVTFCL